MREDGGLDVINEAINKLSKTHVEHITQYGLGNELRLTGKHEVYFTSFLQPHGKSFLLTYVTSRICGPNG